VFKPALNITEQLAAHLAQQIICGELTGGERIQELKVAKHLGVSRGSVRESLLILEKRHLIEIVPRKGAIVNRLNVSDALELVELLYVLEVRWMRSVLNHAARPTILSRTELAITNMDVAAREQDSVAVLNAREAFYIALLAPANRYSAAVFESLLPTSQRVISHLLRRGDLELHDIARYYKALHHSIAEQDEDRARELLSAFYRRLEQLCAKAFAPNSADQRENGVFKWASRAGRLAANVH